MGSVINHEAVGQNVLLNVARFGRHIEIVTQAGRKGKQKRSIGLRIVFTCTYNWVGKGLVLSAAAKVAQKGPQAEAGATKAFRRGSVCRIRWCSGGGIAVGAFLAKVDLATVEGLRINVDADGALLNSARFRT